jgi:hypothetical protein
VSDEAGFINEAAPSLSLGCVGGSRRGGPLGQAQQATCCRGSLPAHPCGLGSAGPSTGLGSKTAFGPGLILDMFLSSVYHPHLEFSLSESPVSCGDSEALYSAGTKWPLRIGGAAAWVGGHLA